MQAPLYKFIFNSPGQIAFQCEQTMACCERISRLTALVSNVLSLQLK